MALIRFYMPCTILNAPFDGFGTIKQIIAIIRIILISNKSRRIAVLLDKYFSISINCIQSIYILGLTPLVIGG